jgi:hypothetical protein
MWSLVYDSRSEAKLLQSDFDDPQLLHKAPRACYREGTSVQMFVKTKRASGAGTMQLFQGLEPEHGIPGAFEAHLTWSDTNVDCGGCTAVCMLEL